jgi:HSP20 family protein
MATVTRWNPVREMITLREAMDQLMNDRYFRDRDHRPHAQTWQLPVDAYTSEDAIVIKADVPGLKPEELEVTLEGDVLTIRGELKTRTEDKNYLLRERASGQFERIMTVNVPIDVNKVEAAFENGVLTLTLPKAEAVKPKQIKINATNGKK